MSSHTPQSPDSTLFNAPADQNNDISSFLSVEDMEHFEPGDEVFWGDPAEGLSSGYYTIDSILSDSGRIEELDTIVVLRNKAGSWTEAYAHEIR